MSLVKKMILCGLALSLALGGIAGGSRVSAENGSLTTGQKIVGGVSAVGGIGLLAGIGIGTWHHYHNLPVLIIGGDDAARTALIDKLKNSAPLKNATGKKTLVSAIEKKTAEGVKTGVRPEYRVKGTGKTRAQFKNWNIKQCDASDAKAADLMKEAQLVIVLVKSNADVYAIKQLISKNVKGTSRIVASVECGNFTKLTSVSQRVNVSFDWDLQNDSFSVTSVSI